MLPFSSPNEVEIVVQFNICDEDQKESEDFIYLE